jgi:hypothetical protein
MTADRRGWRLLDACLVRDFGHKPLIAWAVADFAYVCTRWTTRIHFKDYGDRPVRICEEWRLRWK